jgi:hypothetical protein
MSRSRAIESTGLGLGGVMLVEPVVAACMPSAPDVVPNNRSVGVGKYGLAPIGCEGSASLGPPNPTKVGSLYCFGKPSDGLSVSPVATALVEPDDFVVAVTGCPPLRVDLDSDGPLVIWATQTDDSNKVKSGSKGRKGFGVFMTS